MKMRTAPSIPVLGLNLVLLCGTSVNALNYWGTASLVNDVANCDLYATFQPNEVVMNAGLGIIDDVIKAIAISADVGYIGTLVTDLGDQVFEMVASQDFNTLTVDPTAVAEYGQEFGVTGTQAALDALTVAYLRVYEVEYLQYGEVSNNIGQSSPAFAEYSTSRLSCSLLIQVNVFAVVWQSPGLFWVYYGTIDTTTGSVFGSRDNQYFLSNHLDSLDCTVLQAALKCPANAVCTNQNVVSCQDSTNNYVLNNACVPCPPGKVCYNSAIAPCLADTYGTIAGQCTNCPAFSGSNVGSVSGAQCVCQGMGLTSKVGANSDGSPICGCSAGLMPISTGCQACPADSSYDKGTGLCVCADSNAKYLKATNTCLCQGARFTDSASGACLPCGDGTDPSASGCVCRDSTERLDSNNNCQNACPINQYAMLGYGARCLPCPAFSTSLSGSETGSDCTCSGGSNRIGSFQDGSPNCICPAGVIETETGCQACPADSTFVEPWYPCTCHDPNAEYSYSGNICECTAAHFLDPTSNACLACGTGTDPTASGCVCLILGQLLDINNNCFTPCPSNTYKDPTRGNCVSCPSLSTSPSNSTSGTDCICTGGTTIMDTYPWLDHAPLCGCGPQLMSISTGCQACPADSTFINDWNYWKLFCACSDPNAQYIFVGNVCQCRAGHYLDATSQVCLACGAGTDPNATGCVCLDKTYTLDAQNTCQPPCPVNTYGEPGSVCTNCPIFSTSSTNSTLGSACTCTGGGTVTQGVQSDGTPKCGCAAGLMLLSTGCQACPLASTFVSEYQCDCTDPNALYWPGGNVCRCKLAYFQDPQNSTCLPCGTGTDPTAYGCVCLDTTANLNAQNNCVPAASTTGTTMRTLPTSPLASATTRTSQKSSSSRLGTTTSILTSKSSNSPGMSSSSARKSLSLGSTSSKLPTSQSSGSSTKASVGGSTTSFKTSNTASRSVTLSSSHKTSSFIYSSLPVSSNLKSSASSSSVKTSTKPGSASISASGTSGRLISSSGAKVSSASSFKTNALSSSTVKTTIPTSTTVATSVRSISSSSSKALTVISTIHPSSSSTGAKVSSSNSVPKSAPSSSTSSKTGYHSTVQSTSTASVKTSSKSAAAVQTTSLASVKSASQSTVKTSTRSSSSSSSKALSVASTIHPLSSSTGAKSSSSNSVTKSSPSSSMVKTTPLSSAKTSSQSTVQSTSHTSVKTASSATTTSQKTSPTFTKTTSTSTVKTSGRNSSTSSSKGTSR